MYRLLLLLFFTAFVGIVNAESEIPNIAPEIETVSSGGHWQIADQSGRYRIIVVNSGWEHIHSQVFLQWILSGSQGQGPSILFSVPIQEINDSPVWSVGVIEFQEKTQKIKLQATNSYTLENQVFIIIPQSDGNYKLIEYTE